MDEDLVRTGRYARLDFRGRGAAPRRVTVGYVEGPDGTLFVAARDPAARWAQELELGDGRATITVADRTTPVQATALASDDPRRSAAIRDLILRYGTPSERIGAGAVFALAPLDEEPPPPGSPADPPPAA